MSDAAIELMATLQCLFRLAGRQTEGFLTSIFALMAVDLPVLDHSTLSGCLPQLNIEIQVVPALLSHAPR